MISLLFWLYIFVSLLCMGSFISSLVLGSLKPGVPWLNEFIAIIGFTAFMVLTQGFLFFFTEISPASSFFSDALFFSLTILAGGGLGLAYLSLSFKLFFPLSQSVRTVLLLSFSSVFALLTVFRWLKPYPWLLPAGLFFSAIPIISVSLLILFRRGRIKSSQSGGFLIILAAAGLLGFAEEYIEFFLRYSGIDVISRIPSGVLTFVGFGLFISGTTLAFSLATIGVISRRNSRTGPSEYQREKFASEWGFTKREKEVLKLVLLRFSSTEIGHSLGISPRTVENHISNIFKKSGASSRFELYDMIQRDVDDLSE